MNLRKNRWIYTLFSFPWRPSSGFQGGLRAPSSDRNHAVQGPTFGHQGQSTGQVKELPSCVSTAPAPATGVAVAQSHGSVHCLILTISQPSFSFFSFS